MHNPGDWVVAEWDAGREPNGTQVEEAVGATVGGGLGRATIREMKKAGHLAPSERAETAPAETGDAGRESRALTVA